MNQLKVAPVSVDDVLSLSVLSAPISETSPVFEHLEMLPSSSLFTSTSISLSESDSDIFFIRITSDNSRPGTDLDL